MFGESMTVEIELNDFQDGDIQSPEYRKAYQEMLINTLEAVTEHFKTKEGV